MYDTKLTAHLPGLDIEIARRQSPDGAAQAVTISLRAVPDLATAVDRLLPGMTALLTGSLAPGNSSGGAVFMPGRLAVLDARNAGRVGAVDGAEPLSRRVAS